MSRTLKIIFILSILIIIASVLGLFIPKQHCCGSNGDAQVKYELLLGRAIGSDIQAINQLYDDYTSAGSLGKSEARQWALIGAMAGDEKLTKKYLEMYLTSVKEAKKYDETIIKNNMSAEGARNLAAKLGLTL